jgi:hypothetical protein
MILIQFDKGVFLYQAEVIKETEKAYYCKVREHVGICYDKVGSARRNIWIPKSVCVPDRFEGCFKVKKWFAKQIKC